MSITASNSLGKLNLSMSNCHKLFSFCYRKVWKIIDIRKTFTQFLVTRSLKGLCAFYLSFYFILLFFPKTSKRTEEGNRMQYFVSVFEKERLKGIYPFLWFYNFFFGLLVFSFTIYISRYLRNKTNILRIKAVDCE